MSADRCPHVRIGLVQTCARARTPDENLAAHARPRGAGGGAGRRARLPAGALPHALLLPGGGRDALRASPSRSRARRRRARPARDGTHGITLVGSVFEKRAPGLFHNTAVLLSGDGDARGPLPQDAHPGRPALLREVLLHAGRPRASGPSTPATDASACSSAGTSGSRRPPGSTALAGAEIVLYPTAIGTWSGELELQAGAARRLADRAARRTRSRTASSSSP